MLTEVEMQNNDETDAKVESIWGSLKYSATMLVGLIAISLCATAALAIPPVIVFFLARLVLSQEWAGALAFLTGVSMLCGGALFMARRYEVSRRSGRKRK